MTLFADRPSGLEIGKFFFVFAIGQIAVQKPAYNKAR